jgi:diamine N-acetyltransferase
VAHDLANPGAAAWIAEDGDGQALGYVWLREGGPAHLPLDAVRPIQIWRVFVDQTWHGTGVAAALMNHCLAEAERRRADLVWLAVWQQAERPIAFYRKLGFAVIATATFTMGDHQDEDFLMARPATLPPESLAQPR